jgi:hypothetical protein
MGSLMLVLELEIKILYSIPHLQSFAFCDDVPPPAQCVSQNSYNTVFVIFLNWVRSKSVRVGFVVENVALDIFFSNFFSIHLPAYFDYCSLLIFQPSTL